MFDTAAAPTSENRLRNMTYSMIVTPTSARDRRMRSECRRRSAEVVCGFMGGHSRSPRGPGSIAFTLCIGAGAPELECQSSRSTSRRCRTIPATAARASSTTRNDPVTTTRSESSPSDTAMATPAAMLRAVIEGRPIASAAATIAVAAEPRGPAISHPITRSSANCSSSARRKRSGSRPASMPTTTTRRPDTVNDSVRVVPSAAAASGLWAPSRITVGSAETISTRPGIPTCSKAAATSSGSMPPWSTDSTASRAIAALPHWWAPCSGRNSS